MAPQMDMNHPENASSVPSDEKKHEHEQDNEQDHDNDNDNDEPAPASRLDGIAQQATAAEPTATTIPKPTPSSFSSSSSSSEENTEKRCVGSISFDETSIIKQLSKSQSQSKSKNEAEIGDETESVESESDASPIESESHPDGADEDEDADADATPTTTPAAASSPLAVDTSAAPCLEPEGTTPVVRDASRRFSAEMLRQVLEDSGNEQEHETAATTAEAAATGAGTATGTGTGTSTGLTSTATSTSTSIPMDGTEDNGNESDPTAEEEVSSRDNSDTEDIEGKTSKKKPKEPPGSPAKRRRSYSESASERERRVSEKENKPSSSLFQQRNVGASIDENETGDIDEKMGDEQEQEQSLLSREPAGTLTSPIMFDNNDDRPEPTTMIQAKVEAEAETETIAKNTPERELGQPIMQSSPQSRLTPNSLSPDFFLGDHDQDNIRIPTLPPLVVPRVGSTASYDSTSSMRQSRQLHPNINNNNNNGYHQQPLTTLSSFHSIQQQQQQQQHYKQQQQQQQSGLSIPNQVATMPGGKRKIHLHLWEDISSLSNNSHQPARRSSFLSFRRKKGILRKNLIEGSPIFERGSGFGGGGSSSNDGNDNANGGSGSGSSNNDHWANRGILTVSWYEGTTSVELQEHVQNSVVRKLGLKSTSKLLDFRVLDESSNPPEEIVLSPYIPDGSRLTVRFATATYDGNDDGNLTPPKYTRFSDFDNGPPDSPSAAPSPYPTSLDLNGLGLNANQLALLGTRLNSLQVQVPSSSADSKNRDKLGLKKQNGRNKSSSSKSTTQKSKQEKKSNNKDPNNKEPSSSSSDDDADDDNHSKESSLEVASLHPEDAIQKSLRDITSLLLQERAGRGQHYGPRQPPQQEKRQVVFVLANYFVLFLSLIAISAEIQARAPGWHAAMEQQLMNVQDCSKDKESLFQCVESGDMAGLVASVVLWMSRSAATKRIFLFGFSSPNKLWTAVYESLVTSICWGFSYMFIRRGMNPDNNRDFLRRYWKDAVYGSLAGFNAAFMKQVLKNLIPQEVIEDALQERQLKILSWLPSLKQREN